MIGGASPNFCHTLFSNDKIREKLRDFDIADDNSALPMQINCNFPREIGWKYVLLLIKCMAETRV